MAMLTSAALLDQPDPTDITCQECGAYAGEECRDHCTAAPSLAIELDAPDALADSPAGRLALSVVRDLRDAHLPGNPRATTVADGGVRTGVIVVVSHPSGRDWIVATVEVWDDGPVFQIAEYRDADPVWVDTRDAFSRAAAARAIVDIAARRAGAPA